MFLHSDATRGDIKSKDIEKRGFLKPHVAKFYVTEELSQTMGVRHRQTNNSFGQWTYNWVLQVRLLFLI